MVTIELTDEEFYIMKDIMQRIIRQKERKPRARKWIKHDGCMINLKTGSMIDVSSNKFVIDQAPDLRALADQMLTPQLPDLQEHTSARLERSQ